MNASPLAAFWVVVVIHWLWGGVLCLAGPPRNRAPDDTEEKLRLLLMLAPMPLGLMALLSAPLLAGLLPAVPIGLGQVDLGMIAGLRTHAEAAGGPIPDLSKHCLSITITLYALGFLARAIPLLRSQAHLRTLATQARRSPLQSEDIYLTGAIVSPFLSNRGHIVIPAALLEQLSPMQLESIVAHERAHRERADHRYFSLLAWLDALLWFNPFLRRQIGTCRLAAELACDAAVTRSRPQVRHAYARALLSVLRFVDRHPDAALPALDSFTRSGDYRMRLRYIMGQHTDLHRPRRTLGLALLLAPLAAAQLAYAGGEVAFTVAPLEGRITSAYGTAKDPFQDRERQHHGIDIAATAGTPIFAPAAGTVVRVRRSDEGYGNVLEIDHGEGYITRYAQLRSFAVAKGERVVAGEVIAHVGSSGRSTGPHLHLEVIRDGRRIDPATVLELPAQ